jgi:signal transduction histidine kinase
MMRWTTSLRGRLLLIAALSTVGALLFAAFAIGHVLERFVMRGLDDRLDAQVMVLARAVGDDGALVTARAIDLPAFGDPGSDWTWRVDAPDGRHWTSSPDAPIARAGDPDDRRRHRDERRRIYAAETVGPYGERLHLRQMALATNAGPVVISASGPRRMVDAPLREALVPLLGSLAILGAGLALATLVQLRLGLRPLVRLRLSLADVRAGRRRHVPPDQPEELSGIVGELNALIDQNEAGLTAARRHVSNLAHGMKTPLAALSVRLGEGERDPDGALREMVAQIDERIRHHLGRARTATPAGRSRCRTMLAPAIADLITVLERIHADRAIAVHANVPVDVLLAVDPQDLDEMLGNILDNGWRHASGAIAIGVTVRDAMAMIVIEDDGPGLSGAAMRAALVPGLRLDEAGEGYGFGLSIVQELAELNGGTVTLARSLKEGWGLAVELALPCAIVE